MWEVEVIVNWPERIREIWTGLTYEQARAIHRQEFAKGYPSVHTYRID